MIASLYYLTNNTCFHTFMSTVLSILATLQISMTLQTCLQLINKMGLNTHRQSTLQEMLRIMHNLRQSFNHLILSPYARRRHKRQGKCIFPGWLSCEVFELFILAKEVYSTTAFNNYTIALKIQTLCYTLGLQYTTALPVIRSTEMKSPAVPGHSITPLRL